MKKLLSATAISCVLVLSAVNAEASTSKKAPMSAQETSIIKASYSLPKKDGDDFRQTMREADEENATASRQILIDHADLYDLLTAKDFDRNAFLTKSKELRELQEQTKENRDEAFASAVLQLEPGERVTLANALEKQGMSGKSPHHHHKHVASSGSSDNAEGEHTGTMPEDQNARSGNTPEQPAN